MSSLSTLKIPNHHNILYGKTQLLRIFSETVKNVNIKFDIFSCFYRFAVLHNT